ncbi:MULTISPECIES: phage baseplate assembly protein V [Enterobacterales]|uniref:Phage lower baseplate protein (TP901-1-like ORF49) n=1 Tax=Enterobacter roggenkampii TaxID=1812935 RepID=A0ABY0J9I5_9ENTR|nr:MULTISPECIES: phage baseplate assembly protein V [Enterobacteriaceae]WGZ99826.1 phage baseplate assembly protein V [Klebsiella michiganensis]HDN6545088.1 phage baseplate assembly protein V [Salmonella enterica subsp. enterica serovar Chester]PKR62796.1 phage baseplate assembly protein V [Escherichia coli]SAB61277.1 Phage lower baseplate protein (TP901-1-like ORF49) [Enterobacter roggenkampii]VAL08687.1 Phage lower baseplate protein (TP901-1-like ORF49) [Enterobacter hormaechei]
MSVVTRQVGTVSAVDADKVQARVRLPECDNLRTNWLNVLQRNTQNNKDYWLPDVGEQVEVLLDANGEDGVILGAVYSDVDKPPFSDKNVRGTKFSDGAEFSYNRASHTLTIRGGIEHMVIECSADVMVKTQKATIDAPQTEVTGDLLVKGKLTYEGGMAGSGGEGAAATIQGNVEIEGNAHSTGSMLSDGDNSNHHSH